MAVSRQAAPATRGRRRFRHKAFLDLADMNGVALPGTLVVNFNSPELHHLAKALAHAGALARYVRPYVNKGRLWERGVAALPMAGQAWAQTFGRRTLGDPRLAVLTEEAGVVADVMAAGCVRATWLRPATRHRLASAMHRSVREGVARAACAHVAKSDVVVAYEGFAMPAFDVADALGGRTKVLNYPVAHHRHRRRVRLEENEREPEFACTWPDFDDWPDGHEQRLDDEIAGADAVLVGSSYAAQTFLSEGIDAKRTRVVPYGVDLDVFTPGPDEPPPGFHVIYAGQLTQRKGLAYLLRGYRRFARAGTHLTLVGSIVGGDQPLRPFASLFDHVAHQTRPALAERYRSAHVFVLPTLIEGMPLVVLEAMACGLPVIVTANGPADIVRDGIDGFIVPERDDEAIAERLDHLHRHPELRREMGRQAALRALDFSWDAYAERALWTLAELMPVSGCVDSRLAAA